MVGEITELLRAARNGDASALDRIFAEVYPTLRSLAGSCLRGSGGDATLDPTALVHETYLKLIGAERLDLADRHHFFACAARAMRHILIDHARARIAQRRGGGADRVELDTGIAASQGEQDLLDLDRSLEGLDAIDTRLRELVELRVFAGMTLEQIARSRACSLRTVNREWQRARALLMAQMADWSGDGGQRTQPVA
jgi:RNA polymerase sigma factor (TIGR02999 family)